MLSEARGLSQGQDQIVLPKPLEQSQMRESSISPFRDLMKMVVENHKREMKNIAQEGLLPLFFHMSDQTWSVAKASGEALLAAADLLKRKQLQHQARTQQTWRIGECLLKQDRSRAQEFLNRSLLYLKNAQASLREEAMRFIGLAERHLRDASKEKLAKICRALQALEKDSEPSICSLAAQTIVILSSARKWQRSRWILRALCCWHG
nr:uncharacterized protein LOC110362641 isoform X2 [Columba livia]